jgi:hypothetical protein
MFSMYQLPLVRRKKRFIMGSMTNGGCFFTIGSETLKSSLYLDDRLRLTGGSAAFRALRALARYAGSRLGKNAKQELSFFPAAKAAKPNAPDSMKNSKELSEEETVEIFPKGTTWNRSRI